MTSPAGYSSTVLLTKYNSWTSSLSAIATDINAIIAAYGLTAGADPNNNSAQFTKDAASALGNLPAGSPSPSGPGVHAALASQLQALLATLTPLIHG